MSETQALQLIELLEKQVYYQGATLYALAVAVGATVAVGVCFLLYRAIKNFY